MLHEQFSPHTVTFKSDTTSKVVHVATVVSPLSVGVVIRYNWHEKLKLRRLNLLHNTDINRLKRNTLQLGVTFFFFDYYLLFMRGGLL